VSVGALKRGILFALAAAAFAAAPAAATHDVPADASPLHLELVPELRQTISSAQCTARGGTNSTHGPPLSFGSCSPPGVLPGTQARIGPQSTSGVDVTVVPGDTDPGNGDQADVTIVFVVTDVQAVAGGDYNPVATGTDVLALSRLRVSDHLVSPPHPSGGTVIDFEFTVPVMCVATGDPTAGSTCAASTTADSIVPAVVRENLNMVVQTHRVRLNDAGPDNTPGNADDKRLASQGIYIP
jgi:hypothetical protein